MEIKKKIMLIFEKSEESDINRNLSNIEAILSHLRAVADTEIDNKDTRRVEMPVALSSVQLRVEKIALEIEALQTLANHIFND